MFSRRRVWWIVGVVLAIGVASGVLHGQRYFREGSFPARWAPRQMPDASFVICRVAYRQVRAEQSGIGWMTDYPYAEINLTTRLSELTKTTVSRDGGRQPNHYSVRLTDESLFNCPVLFMSDAGTVGFRDDEVENLRTYLLKGGFLWADDFWGSAAWNQFATQIARVLPSPDFIIEDVKLDDPMLRSMFEMKHIPQITNIRFWRMSGGRRPPSEATTATKSTSARSATRRGAWWCSPRTTPTSPIPGSARARTPASSCSSRPKATRSASTC